jgi:hypothetical protein
MKLLANDDPNLTDIQSQESPEALTDMEALEAMMNEGLDKKGRSDPATVALQLAMEYKAYFAERMTTLLGNVERLNKERDASFEEANHSKNVLDKLGTSATRQVLGWPSQWPERLSIIFGLLIGLLIVVLDWTGTMEFLLPMTDNRRMALLLSGLIFSIPLLEGYYYLRAKEEEREKAVSRHRTLTLFFGFLWLVVLQICGNQASAPLFSSTAQTMEFLPPLRGLLQVLTATFASGVAFLMAVGPFLRLPAVSLGYISTQKTLDAALEKVSKAGKAAAQEQGKINRIQAQLEAINHKTQARLENFVRIDAAHELEKSRAKNSMNQ